MMERSPSVSSLLSRSPTGSVYESVFMPEIMTSGTSRGVKSATSSGSKLKSAVSVRSATSRPASGVSIAAKSTRPQKKGIGKLKKNGKTKESDDPSVEDEEEQTEPESSEPEEKLGACLEACLTDCSRQRLRALHMSLRHYGNVDNRVSPKDTQSALQENQIKLTERSWLMILELFGNENGLDYEGLFLCLSAAHLKTGRDSIKARIKRNDTEAREIFRQEDVDEDFIRRLEELLIQDHTFYDIDSLRTDFSKWDSNRVGKVDKEGATLICDDKTPLYGALLKNILNRCDEDNDNKISWPLFLNFLERAQCRAWEKCPELSTLPEKAKEVASRRVMTPDPLDELSSSARNAVSRLLKKAQKRRGNSTDSSPDPPLSRDSRMSQSRPVSVASDREPANQSQPPNDTSQGKTPSTGDKDNGGHNGGEPDQRRDEGRAEQEPRVDDTIVTRDDKRKDENKTKEMRKNGGENTRIVPGTDIEVVVPLGFKGLGSNLEPPKERLQLEWVYGYRGKDSHNKLQLVSDGSVVYFIASVVIIYSVEEETQRYYREHTDNIKCLSVHSNGLIVASGQSAGTKGHDNGHKACIHVWRCDTLQTIHILGEGIFQKAVLGLAFMLGEDILACADNSPEKKLIIWDTKKGTMVAETFVNTSCLCDLQFNPRYPETLVTAGKEHLEWWRVNKEAGVVQPSALPKYELFLKARFIFTITHTSKGDLVTGDSNGTVYVWGDGGNSVTNYIKHGHDGPVYSIFYHKGTLLTGGRDGFIKLWEWGKNMDRIGNLQLSPSDGGVRSILIHPSLVAEGNSPAFILGTTMNGLFLGHMAITDINDLVSITQSHTDDVRGLATINQSTLGTDMVTASRDGVLCQLNTNKRMVVWRTVLKGYSFTCVDSSPDGQNLVLGTKDGHVVIINVSKDDGSVMEIINRKVTSSSITCAKTAPDFRWLAVGATDKQIYVFCLRRKEVNDKDDNDDDEEEEKWTLHGKWNPLTCHPLPGQDVCEIAWASHSCILDHTVIGMWSSKNLKNDRVTCLDVHPNKHLVAMTTDNNSMLSLFRYPSYSDGAFSHIFKAHNQTRQIRFTLDGCGLVTAGGMWSSKNLKNDRVTCLDVHPNKHLVAMTTDNNSMLSLFRYPSYSDGAFSHIFKAHNQTRQIRFTLDGCGLVTAGGSDLSIMQWKLA